MSSQTTPYIPLFGKSPFIREEVGSKTEGGCTQNTEELWRVECEDFPSAYTSSEVNVTLPPVLTTSVMENFCDERVATAQEYIVPVWHATSSSLYNALNEDEVHPSPSYNALPSSLSQSSTDHLSLLASYNTFISWDPSSPSCSSLSSPMASPLYDLPRADVSSRQRSWLAQPESSSQYIAHEPFGHLSVYGMNNVTCSQASDTDSPLWMSDPLPGFSFVSPGSTCTTPSPGDFDIPPFMDTSLRDSSLLDHPTDVVNDYRHGNDQYEDLFHYPSRDATYLHTPLTRYSGSQSQIPPSSHSYEAYHSSPWLQLTPRHVVNSSSLSRYRAFDTSSKKKRRATRRFPEGKPRHQCPFTMYCKMTLSRLGDLHRHVALLHLVEQPAYACEKCGARFSREESRARHGELGACGKRTQGKRGGLPSKVLDEIEMMKRSTHPAVLGGWEYLKSRTKVGDMSSRTVYESVSTVVSYANSQ